ncbi:MAG: HpaII family restriction endonuclease, partial [Pseudomonadota bacterium]
DKKVFSGDADLNKIEDLFYPIIKFLREEQSGKYEYKIEKNLVFVFGGNKEIKISIEKFREIAEKLFSEIRDTKGVFSLPEVEEFMSSIYCNSLKAKSTNKTDIKVVIHDLRTGLQHLLGFSIKSRLGSPSTLLNAGGDSTNFIYSIKGIDKKMMREINELKKFQDKFELLRNHNAQIEFVSPVNNVFKNNLVYVDYCLPEIIGDIVFRYYSSPDSKISSIVSTINNNNPLGFDNSYNQDFYEHKVKRFLTDVALGLKTATPWKGKFEATGGYLIVKEDGDIICYHIYDKNQFEDYLFNNTRLETPSTTRHLFGNIYEEEGRFFIKLNLQVRFL